MKRGFVALISVIIIALVLMLVTTSLSFSGYYLRFNALDREFKEMSAALASSCVEVAKLRLAKDALYRPSNDDVTIGDENCTIVSIATTTTESIIRAGASYKESSTYLEVGVENNSFDVTYSREVISFD